MEHTPQDQNSGDGAEPGAADALEELLADMAAAPLGERRARWERALQEHPAWRAELERRMAALERMGLSLLPTPEATMPERLGEFRLIERIGGGGMGVVYRAEQTSLQREVALKLVRPELLYFPGSRERFRRETEAVARLEHPGIVGIHVVGEEGGLPYFAMELVRGCSVAELLSELRGRAPESLGGEDLRSVVRARIDGDDGGRWELPLGSWVEASIELVRQVAVALQHAHERDILHRDVKPSNVLIGGDGRAHLVDFGLTSGGADEAITRTGAAIGTLVYMSPEQVRGNVASERSDVYSLGATLYELLALQPPYRGDNALALSSAILDGAPTPIRARNHRVPVDAEVVCLKAMERDPSRRYAACGEFADDLERVLERRPVAARPPGRLLRLQRWIQRNPAGTAAVALGLLLFVGAPSVLLWQSRRHAGELEESLLREQRLASERQNVTNFLVDLFDASDPDVAQGEELTARQILARGVERMDDYMQGEPRSRAALLLVLGRVHDRLSDFETSGALLEEAVTLLRADPEAEPEDLAPALGQLADFVRMQGEFERARDLAEEALVLWRDELGADGEQLAESLTRLAGAYVELRRMDEAEALQRRAIEWLRGAGADRGYAFVTALDTLARILMDRVQLGLGDDREGLPEEAERLWREALSVLEAHSGETGLDAAHLKASLALAVKFTGRLEEAEALYRETAELIRARVGGDNERVGVVLSNLSAVQMARGDLEAALESQVEAERILARFLHGDHPALLVANANHGGLAYRLGRWREAADVYAALLPRQLRVFGEDHPYVPRSMSWGAVALAQCGDPGAEPALRAALERVEAVHGAESVDLVRPLRALAETLTRQEGAGAEAADLARRGLELVDQHPTAESQRELFEGLIEVAESGLPAGADDAPESGEE